MGTILIAASVSLLLFIAYVIVAYKYYINEWFENLPTSYRISIAILSPLLAISYFTNLAVSWVMSKFNVSIYMEISYSPVTPVKPEQINSPIDYETTDMQSIIDQLEQRGIKAQFISSEEELKKVLNKDEQAYPMMELPKKKNTYH